MSEQGWRNLIVGDRMRVDQEFSGTVQNSSLSSSEWSLVMTAVEFDVEGEGDSARLVADTSQVESILPEIEKLAERMGGQVGGRSSAGPGSGIVASIRDSLGLGSGGLDDEKRNDAMELPQQYANALQSHLEDRGKWEMVLERSAAEDQPSPE